MVKLEAHSGQWDLREGALEASPLFFFLCPSFSTFKTGTQAGIYTCENALHLEKLFYHLISSSSLLLLCYQMGLSMYTYLATLETMPVTRSFATDSQQFITDFKGSIFPAADIHGVIASL